MPGLGSIYEGSNPINIVFADYGGPGEMTTKAGTSRRCSPPWERSIGRPVSDGGSNAAGIDRRAGATRARRSPKPQGLALGISARDGDRFIRTYGFANRDAQVPVAEETLFEIGSISKSFLAIVFMQLAAEGKIDLHAPVTDYLPWFSVRSDHAPITAHHLLCHTAGLPAGFEHRPDGLFELWELRNVRAGAPGELCHYSNVGYSLLGVLAETVLGQPFDQLMRERVLDPLGFSRIRSLP